MRLRSASANRGQSIGRREFLALKPQKTSAFASDRSCSAYAPLTCCTDAGHRRDMHHREPARQTPGALPANAFFTGLASSFTTDRQSHLALRPCPSKLRDSAKRER